MYEPKVITAPTKEPVSITEARNHCRIIGGDEDAQLDMYIKAARRWFEWRTGRTIHQTTYEYVLDAFPSEDFIILPRATPLISITSIKYKDSAGTETTWSATEYIADTDNEPGRVVLGYGYSWPSFTPYPSNPIRIRYVAGIATSSPVDTEADESVKIPILLLVGGLYENREAEPLSDVGRVALKYGAEAFIAQNVAAYSF